MTRRYSMAYLTADGIAPPEAVTIAAKAGYSHLGVRMLPAAPGGAHFPLMNDPAMLRETLTRLRDTGLGVFDLEIIRLSPSFRAADYLAFMETGAKLGAKAILVACDDPDEIRTTASFAALCEAAQPFGLTADLEFMPWTHVPDANSAKRVVGAACQPNGGILVDGLHFGRSNSNLADIASIPRSWLNYAQICDAPAEIPTTHEGLIHTARCARLLPGEGGIDLKGLFRTLPQDLPVSVEIPHEIRAPIAGPEKWARDALLASMALIERLEGART